MSNTPATHEDGFEVVVSEDGSVTIPPSELAHRGIRPGAHLRVIPEQRVAQDRRGGRSAGKLAGAIPGEVVDEWVRGLDEDRATALRLPLVTKDRAIAATGVVEVIW